MSATRSLHHFESVDDETAAILRAKTPAERLQIAGGMWRFAREMIVCVLKQEHPDWDEERIRKEAARRLSHGAL
jgi:hypothetical protein